MTAETVPPPLTCDDATATSTSGDGEQRTGSPLPASRHPIDDSNAAPVERTGAAYRKGRTMHPETSREGGQHRRTRRTTEAAGARAVDRFTWERELRTSGLPFGTRGVLAILGGYMNRDGSGAWPSLDTLSDSCGLSRRQLSNHLRPALELGWIARESGRGPGSATSYAARLPGTESGQRTALTQQKSGQPSARTPQRAGSRVPESGQPTSGVRAAECPPPSPDQDKTNLSLREEAPAVMIDPEQIKEEREQDRLSHDNDSPSASGAELVQRVAAADGADPAKWSPERQERVKDRVARHPELGGTCVPLVRPLLLELASRAGSITAPVDAYVSGILSSPTGTDDIRRLAEAGQRRIPKPPKLEAVDRLSSRERGQLLEDIAAELIESGDVIPDWQHDSDRDRFERLIHHHANQRARRRQPMSA